MNALADVSAALALIIWVTLTLRVLADPRRSVRGLPIVAALFFGAVSGFLALVGASFGLNVAGAAAIALCPAASGLVFGVTWPALSWRWGLLVTWGSLLVPLIIVVTDITCAVQRDPACAPGSGGSFLALIALSLIPVGIGVLFAVAGVSLRNIARRSVS